MVSQLAANRSSSPCRPYAASPKPRAKSCRAGSTIYTGDDRPSPEPRAGEDSVKTPSYAGERSLTPPSPTSSSRASPNGPSRGSLNGKSGHRPRGVSVAQLSPRGQQEVRVGCVEFIMGAGNSCSMTYMPMRVAGVAGAHGDPPRSRRS